MEPSTKLSRTMLCYHRMSLELEWGAPRETQAEDGVNRIVSKLPMASVMEVSVLRVQLHWCLRSSACTQCRLGRLLVCLLEVLILGCFELSIGIQGPVAC
jgi:hypothetical protein